ncbi:MAG TPA: 30S ribosome-binding factor RbfA [Pirellulales bacterium]|jgi:ribosome-binding factor A|nr:30S ribosome-binding factor RbfA [Pirellulales bacterium]
MPSRRVLKAAQAIREVVSMAILAELKDPRVEDVTVTYVEVTPDMRQAKVHVSIMGSDTKQKLGLRGLQSAAGFLQSKVANRIDTRYTPRLEFVLDMGVKKSIEIAEILHRVLPKEPPPGTEQDDSDESPLAERSVDATDEPEPSAWDSGAREADQEEGP